jgi:hypothetical protein
LMDLATAHLGWPPLKPPWNITMEPLRLVKTHHVLFVSAPTVCQGAKVRDLGIFVGDHHLVGEASSHSPDQGDLIPRSHCREFKHVSKTKQQS